MSGTMIGKCCHTFSIIHVYTSIHHLNVKKILKFIRYGARNVGYIYVQKVCVTDYFILSLYGNGLMLKNA